MNSMNSKESQMEKDSKLFQNSISFLHNISNLNFSPPALKCLYLTKSKLMELRAKIQISANTSKTTRCQRCFLPLAEGPANYRVRAQEKKSKFAKKLLAKNLKGKPMTKFQRRYFKRLDQFNGNKLVITCKFCKKECPIKMEKPKKIIPTKLKTSQKKRKSKKKDKFCGLDQKVVMAATPDNKKKETSFVTSEFISLEHSAKKRSRYKRSKKENSVIIVEDTPPKLNFREAQSKLKKKNKLKEFLSTSNTSKSAASNLKQFLQSL